MKEKGLSQRDAVDWIVQIVTLIQFHLGGAGKCKGKAKMITGLTYLQLM